MRIDCLQTDAGSPKDLSCPGRSMGRKLKKAGFDDIGVQAVAALGGEGEELLGYYCCKKYVFTVT